MNKNFFWSLAVIVALVTVFSIFRYENPSDAAGLDSGFNIKTSDVDNVSAYFLYNPNSRIVDNVALSAN